MSASRQSPGKHCDERQHALASLFFLEMPHARLEHILQRDLADDSLLTVARDDDRQVREPRLRHAVHENIFVKNEMALSRASATYAASTPMPAARRVSGTTRRVCTALAPGRDVV